jgi:hypothetical protein
MSKFRAAAVVTVAAAVTIAGIHTASAATNPASLSTTAPSGKNFDLSTWRLQLPNGDTIATKDLRNGYTGRYFWTDDTDGAMVFWAPEKGDPTQHPDFARSELRELTAGGDEADWKLGGTHKLAATIKAPLVTREVCVGRVHLGTDGMYLKAGSYNQSSSSSTTKGAKVKFYALKPSS